MPSLESLTSSTGGADRAVIQIKPFFGFNPYGFFCGVAQGSPSGTKRET